MKITVTWPGMLFVVLLLFQVFLVFPFVFLGDWDNARIYSGPLVALMSGWWLRGWHDEACRESLRKKGTS